MKQQMKWGSLVILCVALVGSACSKGGGSDPKAVADQFWQATKTGKVEKIKPYVTKASLNSEMMKSDAGETQGEYTLSEASIEGDKATVATSLKDQGMDINLQTILVQEDGAWKVDVDATMQSMFGSDAMQAMMKGLEEAGKALGEGLEKLGDQPSAEGSTEGAAVE